MIREFEYTVKKTISEEDLRNLIIDGLETGIGYWALLHNDTEEFDKYYANKAEIKNPTTSEIVADIILKGGSVKITDIEDVENPEYELTLERLLIGIQKNAEERPHDCDLENADATTSDCIFQYALYNEVVFG